MIKINKILKHDINFVISHNEFLVEYTIKKFVRNSSSELLMKKNCVNY